MKVNVIKGPMYEEREKQAHELLFNIIAKEIQKEKEKKVS